MKVCEFCGVEHPDSAVICSSCGANEFKNKCGNCGTIFDEGNFCPNCGVKAGAKPKKCPNCSTEYYSNACPNCGYTKNGAKTAAVFEDETTHSPDKKYIGLWVFGWIMLFPVPLTILMVKNKKLNKYLRIAIIVLGWLVYLSLALING